MDPARFPHAPHTLAPDSQIPLWEDPVMERRRFIEAIAGGFLAAPLAAEAQQPGKVPRIGLITGASESMARSRGDAVRQALHEVRFSETGTHTVEAFYLA